MNLETVSVDAPWTGGKKPSPDRWMIIGRTRDAVWNQMREIEKGAAGPNTGGGEPKTKKAKVSNGVGESAVESKTLNSASSSTPKAPVTQKPKPSEPRGAEGPRKKQTARKNAFPESSLSEYEHPSAAPKSRPKQTARKWSSNPHPHLQNLYKLNHHPAKLLRANTLGTYEDHGLSVVLRSRMAGDTKVMTPL